jgi:hypothetical protein
MTVSVGAAVWLLNAHRNCWPELERAGGWIIRRSVDCLSTGEARPSRRSRRAHHRRPDTPDQRPRAEPYVDRVPRPSPITAELDLRRLPFQIPDMGVRGRWLRRDLAARWPHRRWRGVRPLLGWEIGRTSTAERSACWPRRCPGVRPALQRASESANRRVQPSRPRSEVAAPGAGPYDDQSHSGVDSQTGFSPGIAPVPPLLVRRETT